MAKCCKHSCFWVFIFKRNRTPPFLPATLVGVLVFCDLCNKVPRTWFKTAEMCSHSSGGLKSEISTAPSKSKFLWGRTPFEGPRGEYVPGLFSCLVTAGIPCCWLLHSSLCLCLYMTFFSSVSNFPLHPFYMNTICVSRLGLPSQNTIEWVA